MTALRPHDARTSSTPLALATIIAGGTLAYADPVRFESDGSFDWHDNLFLDITKGPSKQVGAFPGPGTFLYYRVPSTCCAPRENRIIRGGLTTAQIAFGNYATRVRDAGALVPDDFGYSFGVIWGDRSLVAYYYASGLGFYTQFDKSYPRDPGYIATRFEIEGATHYGWMSLKINSTATGLPVLVFELLAWGYETDPNTPIEAGAVPAPSGALALLAFGAAANLTRARRE